MCYISTLHDVTFAACSHVPFVSLGKHLTGTVSSMGMIRVNFQQPTRKVALKHIQSRFFRACCARSIVVSPWRAFARSRNIAAADHPQQAPKLKAQAPSNAAISMLQWTCVFTVMGIQAGLVVERIHQQKQQRQQRVQLSSTTVQSPTSTNLTQLSQYQPLLLAIGVACAMVSKASDRQQPSPVTTSATELSSSLQQKATLESLNGSIRLMDRKLSKMQTRVLLCVEQYRAVRTGSEEARATMNNVLSTHGTALAELQEQTNSLQKVVSSMQDVVVKQIQVMAPPLKSLSTRVKSLEEELQALKEQVKSQQVTPSQPAASTTERDSDGQGGSGGEVSTEVQLRQEAQQTSASASRSVDSEAISQTECCAKVPTDSVYTDSWPVGSSDPTVSQQEGGGRMQLASWRKLQTSSSPLLEQPESWQASSSNASQIPVPEARIQLTSTKLPSSLLSYSSTFTQEGLQTCQRTAKGGLSRFGALHFNGGVFTGAAAGSQPDVLSAVGGSGTGGLQAYVVSKQSARNFIAPSLSAPFGGGAPHSESHASSSVQRLMAGLPAETSVGLPGARGILVAASLLVNLLVARACV